MTSSYNDIFSKFLLKITDPSIVSMPEETVFELMKEYIHSTIANPYFQDVFASINYDDTEEILTYELEYPTKQETTDKLFVEDIISRGMVIAWLEPQVKSVVNIHQMFSGKEQKFYSQSNHIAELRGMLSDAQKDLRRVIEDHDCKYNGYLVRD